MAGSDKISTRLCFSAAIFFASVSLFLPDSARAQRLGEQIRVDPGALAVPYATKAASNVSETVTRPSNTAPQVPNGFTASLFASGLDDARELVVAPDGAVLVAEERAGKIAILRGNDQATETGIFLAGLATPSGMVFHGNDFYVADVKGVYRLPYKNGDHKAGGKPEMVTRPGALGSTGGHVTRILAIDPAGRHLTVSDGSSGNIVEDKPPRATIQMFDLDGGNQRTLVSGTRNPVGTQFYPGTDRLWAVINERDGLGDGLVPDYLAEMVEGGFYGWPYAYIGPHKQPGFEGHDDLVAKARVPDLLFRAHSAPLGLVFVTSDRWPARYRGGALVALHGSWNSGVPSGYFVAFVPFANGKPAGSYEPFITGFRLDSDQAAPARARVWGRPVGLAFAADGSLLVSDDVGNTVWRVRAQAP